MIRTANVEDGADEGSTITMSDALSAERTRHCPLFRTPATTKTAAATASAMKHARIETVASDRLMTLRLHARTQD